MKFRRRPWQDLFIIRRDEFGDLNRYSQFDRYRHFFTPTSVLAILLATMVVASIFAAGGRGFLAAVFSICTFLAYVLLSTRTLGRSLEVKRLPMKTTFRENEMVEVLLEIANPTGKSIGPLFINDIFGPATESHVRTAIGYLSGNSITRVKYRRKCDSGMGQKEVGPLGIEVSDPFGVFQFEVTDDRVTTVSVFPAIESIPQLPISPTLDSHFYGIYEVANRGSSVCLAGIRPYDSGDSPRHIAWKLSTRGRGLVVKDFEKSVNANICVILNLIPNWQIGKKSVSTWEYGKDLALAVIQQQIELGNNVGFYSDQTFINVGAGETHFQHIARCVANLKISETRSPLVKAPTDLLSRYQTIFPPGSEVIYVVPFNELESKASEKSLLRLQSYGFHVAVVFMDTEAFWNEYQGSIEAAKYMGTTFIGGLSDVSLHLKSKGVRVYIATHRERLKDAFLKEGLKL